ncbi:hypothetical protein KAW18_01825 [candidate division WOR-3 bacterium]|nr:hypothetical protein [candidate division WOR-3 bacterium]
MANVKYKPSKRLGRYFIVTETGNKFSSLTYGHTSLEAAQKKGMELSKKTGLNYQIIKRVGKIIWE